MTTLEAPSALTGPVPSLPPSIAGAREALATAAAAYLAIPDSALERPWAWREHASPDGIRYGIYRGAETVEEAAAELDRVLGGAPPRSGAAVRIAAVTVARWALQGRLVALPDDLLDRVAAEGEWTARETLGHTINGQRSYGWFSRWWLSQPLGPDRPTRVPDDVERASEADLPGEGAEGAGTVAEIRARLDAVVDEWALRFATLDDASLLAPATWAGIPVDIGFRIGRWASHIAEHTIQLDKTLDAVPYQPTEVQRIVVELYTTWGRLESRIFPVAPQGTDDAASRILAAMGDTLIAEAGSVRAAAEG